MTVSSGMAMEVHYCMGERVSTEFYASSGDTCGRCGMKEKKGGCCSDEQKFIKLSDDHKAAGANYTAPVFFAVIVPMVQADDRALDLFSTLPFHTQAISDSGPPLYLLNCVFRI